MACQGAVSASGEAPDLLTHGCGDTPDDAGAGGGERAAQRGRLLLVKREHGHLHLEGRHGALPLVPVRGLVVGGLDDVRWASLDRILAAALPLAVKRRSDDAGLRLFDAQTLADALVDSEEAYILYRFLKLLEDGNGVAGDVRLKLAAVDLDEGGYPAATPAQVKSALKTARKAADRKRKAAEVAAMSSKRRTRSSPPEG